MITFRISADVKEDRQVIVTLPSEVPTGKAELVVSVTPETPKQRRRPRSCLADWAEAHAEHWGDRMRAADVEGFTGRSG